MWSFWNKLCDLIGKGPHKSFPDDTPVNINVDADWIYYQRPTSTSKNFEGDLVRDTATGKLGTVVDVVRSPGGFYFFVLWDGDESPTDYDEWDERLSHIVPMTNP